MDEKVYLEPCLRALKIYRRSPYGDVWRKMSYHELLGVAVYKARRATLLSPIAPKIEDDILDAINFLVFAYLQWRKM
jgi:hypothetical protein